MTKYGKRKRREQNRHIRSETPILQPYARPKRCYQTVNWIVLGDHLRLRDESWLYNHRVAAFCLVVMHVGADEQARCMYRIDCANPEPDIHEHICQPDGDNVGFKRVLELIPSDGTGRDLVNERYYEYLAATIDRAYDEYERWCLLL